MNQNNSTQGNLKLSEAVQKTIISLEVKKGDRVYSFNVPSGSSLGECYDACFECLAKILEASNNAIESAKSKNNSSKKEQEASKDKDK